MKAKKPEKKKRKWAHPRWKLEDGNPRGVDGKYVKTNGKRVNLFIRGKYYGRI